MYENDIKNEEEVDVLNERKNTEPKKRGRKPKENKIVEQKPIELKKRGRKPICKIIEKKIDNEIKTNDINETFFCFLTLSKDDIMNVINNSKNNSKNNDDENDDINDNKNDNKNDDKNNCIEFAVDIINSIETEKKNKQKMNNDTNKTEKNKKKIYINLNIINECFDNNNKLFLINNKDIKCWWCFHNLENDDLPIGLPENIINDKIITTGYFCSFNCACAYNISLQDNMIWKRLSLLIYLKKILIGNDNGNDYILSAPPRYMLKMFGGNMTIDEFRNNSQKYNKQYRTINTSFQIYSNIIQIEETDISQNQIKNFNNINNASIEKNSLLRKIYVN